MTHTIQSAIDAILAAIPGAPFAETVDTIKVGDPCRTLTGISVTFLANASVIEQAARLGDNLLIVHEPLFYNHLDQTGWLSGDPVYAAKRRLIEEKGLTVWRFHDYFHTLQPDFTVIGAARELGWEPYLRADTPWIFDLPGQSLGELIACLKSRLGIRLLRYVGDPGQRVEKVALIPGFPPAEWHIGALSGQDVDVLVCGEIHEWETSEWVRDARLFGKGKALVVIGHAASEEPGMKAVIPWIEQRLPDVPVHFIPVESPFAWG